jgi:hypothetical protein
MSDQEEETQKSPEDKQYDVAQYRTVQEPTLRIRRSNVNPASNLIARARLRDETDESASRKLSEMANT